MIVNLWSEVEATSHCSVCHVPRCLLFPSFFACLVVDREWVSCDGPEFVVENICIHLAAIMQVAKSVKHPVLVVYGTLCVITEKDLYLTFEILMIGGFVDEGQKMFFREVLL
jgi:hypothetical protein